MDGKNKVLKALKWIGMVLLVFVCSGFTGLAAWHIAPQTGVTRFTLGVAELRCKANEGIKKVLPTGMNKFTIICDNGAHFYDSIVEAKDERMESTTP